MRGRMPWVVSLVVFLVVAGVFVWPEPAKADPHAVFYTAIGQRQLFLNFLAALDQADYVEPATGDLSRDELLKQRNQAILTHLKGLGLPVDESIVNLQDPVLKATNTNLSGLVTRPVTLEGSDAFSAEMLFNHSREIARRAGTAALLSEVFCDQALGRDKCGNSTSEIKNRDRGFVTDPIENANFPFTNGAVANLTSGDPESQAEREAALKEGRHGFVPGYTFDPFIAELRKNIQAGTSGAQAALNNQIIDTLMSLYPLPVHPETYDGLQVAEDGSVKLAYNPFDGRNTGTALAATAPTLGEGGYGEWYFNKMAQLAYLPSALQESAASGMQSINTILGTAQAQGEVADLTLLTRAAPPPECNDPDGFCPLPDEAPDVENLSILPTVRVPVVGKTAQVETAIQALSDLNTNLASVGSTYRIEDPIGNVPLLNPTNIRDQAKVKGATTGEVLAATDNQEASGEQLRQLFGPAPYFGVNDIVPQGEGALRQFLLAIKGQPGCGCNVANVANVYGTPLLNKIKGLSL